MTPLLCFQSLSCASFWYEYSGTKSKCHMARYQKLQDSDTYHARIFGSILICRLTLAITITLEHTCRSPLMDSKSQLQAEQVKPAPIWTLPQELLDIIFDLVYPAANDRFVRIRSKQSWQRSEESRQRMERRRFQPGENSYHFARSVVARTFA